MNAGWVLAESMHIDSDVVDNLFWALVLLGVLFLVGCAVFLLLCVLAFRAGAGHRRSRAVVGAALVLLVLMGTITTRYALVPCVALVVPASLGRAFGRRPPAA